MSEAKAIKSILLGTDVTPLKVPFSKYRKLTIIGLKRSTKHPIIYADDSVGGIFHSSVEISQGDLDRKGLNEPTYDTWAVSAIRQYTKPILVRILFDNQRDAERIFRKLCLEQNANIPKGNKAWGDAL